MIKYKPTSLVLGYKIGLKVSEKYIAVPSQKLKKDEETVVIYQGSHMTLKPNSQPVKSISFDDKFGRGSYTLKYFEWKPNDTLFSTL
jgi:hypothetical protein